MAKVAKVANLAKMLQNLAKEEKSEGKGLREIVAKLANSAKLGSQKGDNGLIDRVGEST